MIILQANVLESPLHEEADADLRLTSFAVVVLDEMSEASSLMAMKRMNVVAADLNRRAMQAVQQAKEAVALGESAPSFSGLLASKARGTDAFEVGVVPDLHWDWGSKGVDAWPRMDFSFGLTTEPLPQG